MYYELFDRQLTYLFIYLLGREYEKYMKNREHEKYIVEIVRRKLNKDKREGVKITQEL